MSSQAATALMAREKAPPWKPGQSGNPLGRPKRVAQLRALSLDTFPDAVARLKRLINSEDEQLAFQAVQFVYLYALGKPAEAQQLAHVEAMQARTAELLVQPNVENTSAEEPSPRLPVLAPSEEAKEVPLQASDRPSQEPVIAEVPPEAAGRVVTVVEATASVPSGFQSSGVSGVQLSPSLGPAQQPEPSPGGLRCLYRDKTGQCTESALENAQWCGPHRSRLFEVLK